MSAIAAKEYVDLDVIIDSEPSGFVVRLESDRGGQAEAPFEPPFTPDELELFLLRLTRPRRAIISWLTRASITTVRIRRPAG